jgi:hypothetical protein
VIEAGTLPIAQIDRTKSAELSERDLTLLLFGHAAFQYLHAGCAFDIFRCLHREPGMSRDDLASAVHMDGHQFRCLMFGLTALQLVEERDGGYHNACVIEELFAADNWVHFVNTVMFEAHIVYGGQQDFVESLSERRNLGLRRIPGSGRDLYHRLSETPRLQDVFYRYMSSWSAMSAPLLTGAVDFSQFRSVVDIGGGDGTMAIAIADAYQSLQVTLMDLPGNVDLARQRIARLGMDERIRVVAGDMFKDPFPAGHDCFMFIHQLVIWPLTVITELLKRAYDALPESGSVLIFSSISNDEENGPLMAALDSVYFVSIPATTGMIYAWKDYDACLTAAGFRRIERRPCHAWTPHGAIIAHK